MSGFSRPAAAKMSIPPSEAHRPRDDLADGMLQFLPGPRLDCGSFAQHSLHGLEERHVVTDAHRVILRNGQRESARQVTHHLHAPLLPALLSKSRRGRVSSR